MRSADVIVVGGGMAGVSAAYEISKTHRVILVEREAHLAYHSTGRSAAMFFQNYGSGPIRPLTVASRTFFTDPPPGLANEPLGSPRGAMWVARPDQAGRLAEIAESGRATGSRIIELSAEEVADKVPVMRGDLLAGGLWEPDPFELDVAAIHQAYLRGFRIQGGTVLTSAPLESLERKDGSWRLVAGGEILTAGTVVNAAGAWGDTVAALAGLDPVGLEALRRTAFMVPGDMAWSTWPMVVDVEQQYYFKPDGPQLLCSPADETPSDPGDARPDPVDIALAIERINQATTLAIRSVRSQWAGLRTFAPDRALVIGPDPDEASFEWLVGQGGTGIQAAPAAAELIAALVRGEDLPPPLVEAGVDYDELRPGRPSLVSAD